MSEREEKWIQGWRIPAGFGVLAVLGTLVSAVALWFDPKQLPTLLAGLLPYLATLVVGLITWVYVRATERILHATEQSRQIAERSLRITLEQLNAKPEIAVSFDGSDYHYLDNTFESDGDRIVRLRLRVTLTNNGKSDGFVAVREPRLGSGVGVVLNYGFEQEPSVGTVKVEPMEMKSIFVFLAYRVHGAMPLDDLRFVFGDLVFESLDRGRFEVHYEAGTRLVRL